MGERGPQKPGREMGCMGAEDTSTTRNHSSRPDRVSFTGGAVQDGIAFVRALERRSRRRYLCRTTRPPEPAQVQQLPDAACDPVGEQVDDDEQGQADVHLRLGGLLAEVLGEEA